MNSIFVLNKFAFKKNLIDIDLIENCSNLQHYLLLKGLICYRYIVYIEPHSFFIIYNYIFWDFFFIFFFFTIECHIILQ